MRYFLSTLFLLIAFTLHAQKNFRGSIKGSLTDTVFVESMEGATITLLSAKDSSVVNYTLADTKGAFEFTNIDTGHYRLIVSFMGYDPHSRNIEINRHQPILDLGAVNLTKSGELLDEVIVEASPVIIKKDTVEFRAGAFQTAPNATAEDLLKRIPGMEVDKDGNVKAQGEDIPKIYVDGKEFFGNDPKMATRNITADMIESIQVYDDMSEQAKFTKIDDGSRQKTINIKLRKDKKKGYFGRAVAGMGSEGRWEGSGTLNKFVNEQRISIVLNGNNTNRSSFSDRDIIGMMGGFNPGGGGGGNGIARNLNGGINFTDKWGKKLEITGSYSYGNTDRRTEQSSLRQTFFPNDSVTTQNQRSFSDNLGVNHRMNLRIEYDIDSMNSIIYSPNLSTQRNEGRRQDTVYTIATKANEQFLALNGLTRNQNSRDGLSINNDLLYRRRFRKEGRTFTFGINNSVNNSSGEGVNFAPYIFYNPDSSVARVNNQDLLSEQHTRSNNNRLRATYTEPLTRNQSLEVNYTYTNNQNNSDRKAFDRNNITGEYDKVNEAQTNYFDNEFLAHQGGLNYRIHSDKYNIQLGGGIQHSVINNKTTRQRNGRDSLIHLQQEYNNFFPSASLRYSFSRTKRLFVRYNGRTNQPSVNQLQEIPDISNPLYVRMGNPNLRQEFNNSLNINYHSFNPATSRYMGGRLSFNSTANKIVNSIDTLGKGIQLIVPVNLNGAWSTNGNINFGFPLKGKLKGSSFNISSGLNYDRNVSMINKMVNQVSTLSFRQGFGASVAIKDKLYMGLNGNITYNESRYSVQENLNTNYVTQNYSTDIRYTIFKTFNLLADFNYYVNKGLAAGFDQKVPLLHTGISKTFFEKKNAELKLMVYDALNQNQSIRRDIGDNYISDVNSLVLRRYVMVSFMYNINKMGGVRPSRQWDRGNRDFH